jgi:hypothetical protein
MGKELQIGALWRRYRVSILFPVFSLAAIFADWNHTRKYKNALAAKQASFIKNESL